MKTPKLGWRPLLIAAGAVAVLTLIVGGCQQKQQPPQPQQGEKPAVAGSPMAQMPQNMLDALHGKRPEGAPAQAAMPQGMMPSQGMPPQGMPPQGMPGGMPPQGMPPQGMAGGMPPQGGMPGGMPKVVRKVSVPDSVKKGWKAVVVQVAESGGAAKDYQVPVGGKITIPGSALTVQVESFLPDFKMTPQGITSMSNDPKNPAAQVVVLDGGKPVFKGWLFKLYPDAHPFQHPKYHLTLKNGVAA